MKLSDNKLVCAHCKSRNMRYYGGTFGGYHYYYRCSDCQKYTELYCSLKNMRIMYFVLCLIMTLAVAVFLILLDIHSGSSGLTILYSFATMFLYAIFVYKYRWSAFEPIARENLPNDRLIIHVPGKRVSLIIVRVIAGIFVAAFIAYVAIFLLNLARQ